MEEFILNEKGELYIRWNINTSYTKLNFNELIAELIQEFRHTGGVYDAFIQNDGKLIGNEKIVIIRNMRDIIQLAIVLKKLLGTKFIKENKSNLLNIKFIDEYTFQMSHQFQLDEIKRITSVKHWYEQYFKKQILSFTEDLKKSLLDKIITEEEATGLVKILDEMLLSAAILYYKLSYENLTN